MKFKTNLKTGTNLIDLTPLVDVIFLMLIFFVITSDILPLKSLNIDNAKLDKDSTPLTTQLLVVMDAQNVIYVGSKKAIAEFATLKTMVEGQIAILKKQHPDLKPTVVLSVDRRVEYGEFLRIFNILQQCCPSLRLVYQNSESKPSIES